MKPPRTGRLLRKWRANWRDSLLLVRQFRGPLLLFCLSIFGGGVLYFFLARQAGEPLENLSQSVYHILGLIFLQPILDFPKAWYLEVFYFVMPVIGTGILATGVADFGVSFFNRRTRSREWEAAVASTFNDHVILVGLGHLGFRVISNLHRMDQDVVVIELNPEADLVTNVRAWGIPVIHDDGVRDIALLEAGIRKARAILLCTQNDSLNLQIALKARGLNPEIHVVIRIFDNDFAHALNEQFGFTALSATGMAAPAFAAAAAGVDMTRPITVEGRSLSLARLKIHENSAVVGLSVGEVEKTHEVSIVLLKHQGDADLHPVSTRCLRAGDIIAVLGGPEELSRLAQDQHVYE